MEDLIYFAASIAVACAVFAVGCIIADYVFPRIPFINHFIDRLPAFSDEESDEEFYEEVIEGDFRQPH